MDLVGHAAQPILASTGSVPRLGCDPLLGRLPATRPASPGGRRRELHPVAARTRCARAYRRAPRRVDRSLGRGNRRALWTKRISPLAWDPGSGFPSGRSTPRARTGVLGHGHRRPPQPRGAARRRPRSLARQGTFGRLASTRQLGPPAKPSRARIPRPTRSPDQRLRRHVPGRHANRVLARALNGPSCVGSGARTISSCDAILPCWRRRPFVRIYPKNVAQANATNPPRCLQKCACWCAHGPSPRLSTAPRVPALYGHETTLDRTLPSIRPPTRLHHARAGGPRRSLAFLRGCP